LESTRIALICRKYTRIVYGFDTPIYKLEPQIFAPYQLG
jgi:hypothetical protein